MSGPSSSRRPDVSARPIICPDCRPAGETPSPALRSGRGWGEGLAVAARSGRKPTHPALGPSPVTNCPGAAGAPLLAGLRQSHNSIGKPDRVLLPPPARVSVRFEGSGSRWRWRSCLWGEHETREIAYQTMPDCGHPLPTLPHHLACRSPGQARGEDRHAGGGECFGWLAITSTNSLPLSGGDAAQVSDKDPRPC